MFPLYHLHYSECTASLKPNQRNSSNHLLNLISHFLSSCYKTSFFFSLPNQLSIDVLNITGEFFQNCRYKGTDNTHSSILKNFPWTGCSSYYNSYSFSPSILSFTQAETLLHTKKPCVKINLVHVLAILYKTVLTFLFLCCRALYITYLTYVQEH